MFSTYKICCLWTEIKLTFSFLVWMPLLLLQVLSVFSLFPFSFWECNVRWLTLLHTGPQDPKSLLNFTLLCSPSCAIAFRVGSPSCFWVSQSMLWPPFLCWVPLHHFAHWIYGLLNFYLFLHIVSLFTFFLCFFICLDSICNCSLEHLDNGCCKITVKWFLCIC